MKENKEKESGIKVPYKAIFPVITLIALFLGCGIGILFMTLIRPITTSQSTTTSTQQDLQSSYIDSEYFNKVLNILKDNYIGEFPDKKDLTYGAVKGLISSLGSKYTSFLNPDEAKQYLDSRNPNFEGIGVTLKFNGKDTEVETTLQNYPAEKAGLKAGDVITEVNNEKVSGIQPQVVASKIRGNAGTDVNLKVIRKEGDSSKTLDFKITRQKIVLENVRSVDLGNGVFRINITQFLDESPEKFNKNWDNVVSKITSGGNVKGIIVDLRNNPGGYVYSVRHVLEEFLKTGDILMSEEQKNTNTIVYKDERTGKFESVQVVVLVNEGSASASEIFAGAIQDHKRGKVVGVKTVGKGVEQTVQQLDDKGILVVVFQKWLTPSGKNISDENPITPDVLQGLTDEDYNKGVDTQLEKAKELVIKN